MDALDVVRALFRAVNDGNLESVSALYHPACVAELVFADGDVVEGRDSLREAWRVEFETHTGGLAGGHRFDVTRIAGIETGWGWVRAEWTTLTRGRGNGAERAATGYSHFWVVDGLIERHRSISHAIEPALLHQSQFQSQSRPASERRYPTKPLVGVGAVIFTDAAEVVLVKRRHEPLAGQWSLPGGMLELGESLEAGVAREMTEETGLYVSVGPVVEVFDRILMDEEGRVRYHFVLVDYLCRVRGGELRAGSDVEAAQLADPSDLAAYRITEKARGVIAKAIEIDMRSHP